jgi:hypothetical protein
MDEDPKATARILEWFASCLLAFGFNLKPGVLIQQMHGKW